MPPLRLPRQGIRLLTLDAFGTIFHPTLPIAQQYLAEARRYGLLLSESAIASSFRHAFRAQARKYPNYGKAEGMDAEEWWANVITSTFHPLLTPSTPLPAPLLPALLNRFSSSHGYTLYPDIIPFLQRLQTHTHNPMVGVVTNSDDRVPAILSSLGLRVGALRYGSRSAGLKNDDDDDDDDGGGGGMLKGEVGRKPEITFVALSYDVGAEKPHRAIFDAARWLAGGREGETELRGEECVHVGDDVEKDYWGARDAGWGAVLLEREEGVEGEDRRTEEVARVASLDDLMLC